MEGKGNLQSLVEETMELVRRCIYNTTPEDIKDIKAITGALKDLKDLVEYLRGESGDNGVVIRIENDPLEGEKKEG